MLFLHAQLSSSAKQAVVICSIVATLLWCSGMIMCAIVAETFIQAYLNAEISQFSQCLGAVPPNPHIWDCLLSQIKTPLLKSLRMGLKKRQPTLGSFLNKKVRKVEPWFKPRLKLQL